MTDIGVRVACVATGLVPEVQIALFAILSAGTGNIMHLRIRLSLSTTNAMSSFMPSQDSITSKRPV